MSMHASGVHRKQGHQSGGLARRGAVERRGMMSSMLSILLTPLIPNSTSRFPSLVSLHAECYMSRGSGRDLALAGPPPPRDDIPNRVIACWP